MIRSPFFWGYPCRSRIFRKRFLLFRITFFVFSCNFNHKTLFLFYFVYGGIRLLDQRAGIQAFLRGGYGDPNAATNLGPLGGCLYFPYQPLDHLQDQINGPHRAATFLFHALDNSSFLGQV
jgi:hypothetical protein